MEHRFYKMTIRIYIGLLAVLLSSCSHYYYMPNAHNVPLFKEKNEYRATVALGGGKETNTTEVQAAYSVTDNVAVMANFMAAQGGKKTSSNWARGYYADAALGYYKPLDDYMVFEVYGGFGLSSQHHQYGGYGSGGNVDLNFSKLFVQPSFGVSFEKLDVALSTRIGQVYFFEMTSEGILNSSTEIYSLGEITANRTSYLLEPALTVRGGWKYLKLQIQLGLAQNLNNPGLKFEKMNLNFGLHLSLPNLRKANSQ